MGAAGILAPMTAGRHRQIATGALGAACARWVFVTASAAAQVPDPGTHHLRSGLAREWESFPERAQAGHLSLHFRRSGNGTEWTLRLRQRDVKQVWRVRLNGRDLGQLVQDENEMVVYLPVPKGAVRDGDNELRVVCEADAKAPSDDVTVGEVELLPRPRAEVLGESALTVRVVDGASGVATPCRVTITDPRGGLVSLGTASGPTLAVRPGVVYSSDGSADLRLPAGDYVVHAGRGFEYSLDTQRVTLKPGQTLERTLAIRRVVPTVGYAACDTHVHTLTYSRHGDASAEERVITLAGEGVEVPVATEHNLKVDYGGLAQKMGVRKYFTPVMGNEVTTPKRGHFNVFPVPSGAAVLHWPSKDWDALGRAMTEAAGDPVVVLNHARDVHGGFRPFDPARHVSVTGRSRDGQDPPINAMEVINSGATLETPMLLYRDWFGLLNRGRLVTPVGSSDSHDVSRYIVGQGRTYVRCDDADPGKIDLGEVRKSLAQGRVAVSYGLLAEMKVNGDFGPGDLVPVDKDVDVIVRVLGPEWTTVSTVTLFANGVPVREAAVPPVPAGRPEPAGEKWTGRWLLPRFQHDVHLVAVARGPGVDKPYWPGAKPYQPTSPKWEGFVVGSTGAVWLDADRSGRFESAYDIASKVLDAGAADAAAVVQRLAGFDEAVAAQAAHMLRERGAKEFESAFDAAKSNGAPGTRRGFETFRTQWEAGSRGGG